LLRRGKVESGTENLAFHNNSIDDNYLYIDVINDSIGVRTTTTTSNELNVNGTSKTTNLIVDTQLTLDNNLSIFSNKIQYLNNELVIQPNQSSDPTVTTTRIGTANLRISDKLIENITDGSNIELTPNSNGRVVFTTTTVNVDGDLHATGDITWDGDITLGNDDTDSVTFVAEIASDIVPDVDNTYDLGSDPTEFFLDSGTAGEYGKEWRHLYVNTLDIGTSLTTENISITTLTVTRDSIFRNNSFIGNSLVDDQVTFNSYLTSSLVPTTSTYTLGTSSYRWDTVFLKNLNIDSVIEIQSNTITTIDYSILDGGSSGLTGLELDGGSSLLTGPSIISGGDSGFSTSVDLKLYAAGTGIINVVSSDVEITNDLTVGQLTTLTNVDITGLLDLTGDYTWSHTGTSLRTGNTDITGSLTVNGANTVQFDDIQFVGNIVRTTLGTDLELSANGTGIVKTMTSNVEITNDLDVLGTGYFNNLTVGAGITNSAFTVGNFYIANNDIITTVGSNIDIVLEANGVGKVYAPTNDVSIINELTVTGDTTVNGNTTVNGVEIGIVGTPKTLTQTGNIDQTGDTYITGNFNNNNITVLSPSYISVPDIKIESNVISVTATDTDLEFYANGTGGVIFDRQLKITSNNIQNIFDVNDINLAFNNILLAEDGQILITESGDEYLADTVADRDLSIIFRPSANKNVIIDSNKALAIPYGNTTNRALRYEGDIRQNSTSGVYEGYSPTGAVSFNNIYDSDQNTYITPELTPGANDNTLRFGINGTVKARITSSSLYSNALHIDNVNITNTTINNLISSTDLEVNGNGTGSAVINNISFRENSITNNTNDAIVLENTGTGYVKFTGTNAIVIPTGNDATRRVTPELAESRYNSERGYAEIFDGTNWIPIRGSASAATEEEVVAETNLWAFVLG
jgi:hypothetical protein